MADVMLRVHRSYLAALRPVLGRVHAMAHITGGGLPGHLNRALPASLDAVVDTTTWRVPNVFARLADAGDVAADEMFRAFNMGVGMVAIVESGEVGAVLASASAQGISGWPLGTVEAGSGRVILEGLPA